MFWRKRRKKETESGGSAFGILRETLEFILSVSESTHPNEFLGLLTADRGVISDVIILPGTRSSAFSAYLRRDMIPLGMRIVGTAHSHPHPHASRPSLQDLQMFAQFGKYHIITFLPYCENCWKCYDSSGNEISLEVL